MDSELIDEKRIPKSGVVDKHCDGSVEDEKNGERHDNHLSQLSADLTINSEHKVNDGRKRRKKKTKNSQRNANETTESNSVSDDKQTTIEDDSKEALVANLLDMNAGAVGTGVSGDEDDVASASGAAANHWTLNNLQDLKKAMKMMSLYSGIAPKSPQEALKKKYMFWETQPVPKIDESVNEQGPIEGNKKSDEVRKDPYPLPEGFMWDTLNVDDPVVLRELYQLLNENYVEDDDNMFRFDYSPEFLQWALKPPHWKQDWHCGVRAGKSNKLVGFISAVPATIRVKERAIKMVEINFLCVYKKLRSKRMTPVLIQEITRRVNLTGIFQAVYTAGVILPKPLGTCRYWHRSLNPKKLIDVKFSHLSRNMNIQRTVKLYKLPENPKLFGFRRLQRNDVKKVHKMLNDYLKKFDLSPFYSYEEVLHWFMPRPDVVDSYVVERNREIIGFTSFYTLPSTVMHHPTYKSIKAAYSFYNVPGPNLSLQDLMNDSLIIAKNNGYDVFNALDLMDNKTVLENLKFGVGDGNLQYYLFNYKCPSLPPEKIGLVLQ